MNHDVYFERKKKERKKERKRKKEKKNIQNAIKYQNEILQCLLLENNTIVVAYFNCYSTVVGYCTVILSWQALFNVVQTVRVTIEVEKHDTLKS
jgi:Na+/melibiose symporter-like transporter